jgi:Uma2 family endonuclease
MSSLKNSELVAAASEASTYIAEEWFRDGPMLRIPAQAGTLDGFREWVTSDEFPEYLRISFIAQELWIDMSPEEVETHNKVKTTVVSSINNLNEELDLGELFSDRMLLTNTAVGLSTEADAALVTWRSYRTGKAHLVTLKGKQGRYKELQGTPDWVLEIVSRWSVQKDTRKLRAAYHRAGIPEYWLIDARGEEIDFQILVRRKADYVAVAPQDGWYPSRVFGRRFRLERRRNRMGRWQYKLRVAPA